MPEIDKDDLIYEAYAIMANAASWDTTSQDEWKTAFERWRDKWHTTLSEAIHA